MSQQITRNEFIRKFNKLDSQAKTAILLKAEMTKQELEEIGDLKNIEASDIVEYFGDHEVIANVWTIMEENDQ